MIIGVPKEIKNNENRVGMTPSGVAEVVKQGHRVFIQHTAGINSGFPDEAYQAVGAHILPTIEDIYATAESDNSRNIPLLILLIRAFPHFVLPVSVFETFAPVVGHFLFQHLKLFVSRHETVGFSV